MCCIGRLRPPPISDTQQSWHKAREGMQHFCTALGNLHNYFGVLKYSKKEIATRIVACFGFYEWIHQAL